MDALRRVLRVVWWLAVALYLGGLVGIGAFAAPAIFQQARALGVAVPGTPAGLTSDRYLGGETFGVVLARFEVMEMVCLVVLAAVAVVDWFGVSVQLSAGWGRCVLRVMVMALLVVGGLDLWVTTPRVFVVRQTWFAAAGHDAAAAEQAHAEFDKLHVRSEQQNQAKVWLLLGLLVISAWGTAPQLIQKKVD